MKESRTKVERQEDATANKIFYLERDFYSNPQMLIVIAGNLEEAKEILRIQLESENYKLEHFDDLKELDISTKGLQIFSPPGDRHMIR